MTLLQEFKAALKVGTEVEVTNHYVTKPDHPCYGTRRATVLTTTRKSFRLSQPNTPNPAPLLWPKEIMLRQTAAGAWLLYGFPTPQDLFLTIRVQPQGLQKCRLVITLDCTYDPERFYPSVDPPSKAGLCDVAFFVEGRCCDHTTPDSPGFAYVLSNATVYDGKDYPAPTSPQEERRRPRRP